MKPKLKSTESEALTPTSSEGESGRSNGPTPLSQLLPPSYGEAPDLIYAFSFLDDPKLPIARSGRRLVVCHRDEISDGQRRIVDDGRQGIGVYNVRGKFYAIKNVCPHAGAELCRGTVHATHRPSDVGVFEPAFEGRILRCPWHGWEFDLASGKGLYDRSGRVTVYNVELDDAGMVIVVF